MGSRRRERPRARARITGVCALPFSRRTLSIESRPRAAGAWYKKNNRRPGGRWPHGRSATGSPRRERAQESARRALRCPRSPTSRAREPPGRPAAHQAGHITVLSLKIRLRRPCSLTLRARGFSFTTRQGQRLVTTALYYHENFRSSLLVGRRGFEIRPGVKSNDRARPFFDARAIAECRP